MRLSRRFDISDLPDIKDALLQWGATYEEAVFLDSNNHQDARTSYEAILAIDAKDAISGGGFAQLEAFQQRVKDWIFGCLSYDLKNDLEPLESNNYDGLEFPSLYFFRPKKLILISEKVLEMRYLQEVEAEMEQDFRQLKGLPLLPLKNQEHVPLKPRMERELYLEKVRRVQEHIHRGDIYEANFCQEFFSHAAIDPLAVFKKLNALGEAPFSAFFRMKQAYLLSSSPERYLKKKGRSLISQPIKGTARRAEDPKEDRELRTALETDHKERSENIMIVDLVRNDLSRIARRGSVAVDELCRTYSFRQVHQLISTISAEIADGVSVVELFKSTFPMGSMTGAPKISAMRIIEALEETKRGWYSGAVGYIDPEGDFDFNVVIRTILYNSTKPYVSYSVGSAITAKSIAETEYQECLVKAAALLRALS